MLCYLKKVNELRNCLWWQFSVCDKLWDVGAAKGWEWLSFCAMCLWCHHITQAMSLCLCEWFYEWMRCQLIHTVWLTTCSSNSLTLTRSIALKLQHTRWSSVWCITLRNSLMTGGPLLAMPIWWQTSKKEIAFMSGKPHFIQRRRNFNESSDVWCCSGRFNEKTQKFFRLWPI